MADNSNGYVKWPMLVTTSVALFGIMVTIAAGGVKEIINNDRLRASEDQRIEYKIEKYTDCLHSIDLRLGRIEASLAIKKDAI